MVRLTINLNGELPPKGAEAVARFNGKVDSLEQHQRALEQEHLALSLREDLPAREMDSEGTRVLFALHDCRREQLDLLAERTSILEDLKQPLADAVATAEDQHLKTTERVQRSLRKLGHSPEKNPVWAVNPPAAEAQFQRLVRTSSDVAAAAEIVAQAHQDRQQLLQQISRSDQLAQDSRDSLRRLNCRLLRM